MFTSLMILWTLPFETSISSIPQYVNKINILEGINVSLTSNKIYGLLGPNGAGKTSLFSILAGLSKPSEGEVLYDSKVVNNLSFDLLQV